MQKQFRYATFMKQLTTSCQQKYVFRRTGMAVSLCKVNCCNIRQQRALYVLILSEFCHCLSEFLLLSATFLILQPCRETAIVQVLLKESILY